ncbi:MAG TPA: hypothetical protein VM912_00255 [Terriglobales bacterium]|nr:hypothetical protein [Terriglobales bacterium]
MTHPTAVNRDWRYAYGSPDAIYEAVDRLLGDERLRRIMGAAGRRWAIEKFACERVLQLNVDFYKSLLKHGSKWAWQPQPAMELVARSR